MTLDQVRDELGLTLGRSGKYRLLVMFKGDFSRTNKNLGIISLFLSGSPKDAEGDVKVFECPVAKCNGVIDPVGGFGTCPLCKRTFPRTKLVGEMAYKTTVDKWAQHISRYLRALNMDCDIYLKRSKEDRDIIEAEHIARTNSGRGGELMNLARRRDEVLYTAGKIIQDTQNGQGVEKAVKAFLLA